MIESFWTTFLKFYNGNKVRVEDVNPLLKKENHLFDCAAGAGKTTIMRPINRMIDPTKGTITINGEDIQKKPLNCVVNRGTLVQKYWTDANT